MKVLSLVYLAASASLVSAHATIHAAWINGVDQGAGNNAAGYIRFPPNNSPLVDVTSKDMTCNINSGPVAKTLSVKAGDKFEFEWHHESRNPGDQIIDPSHKGPVLVYIAPTSKGAAGSGWVKLSEDGFDGSQWAVERLRANGGRHAITIPNITPGQYLLRAEIIALHEGDRMKGAQFYMECVQIEITSSGTTTLPEGVSIPGAYSATDPGIFFDLYNGMPKPYPIPGPAVWDGASSNPVPSSPAATSTNVPVPTSPVPTTFQSVIRTSTTVPPPAATTPPATGGPGAAIWQQCGGLNWSGALTCQSGLTCQQWNPYYYQCIPN